jgi:3-hydroxy-9,10-secoandrosta-1,3,5(10)-triene-9,17-dione monooxygenase
MSNLGMKMMSQTASAVQPSEVTNKTPAVSAEALIDRARALVPALRERATEAEALRRLPDETVRELEAADLCKIWIPKCYGGSEQDLGSGLKILQETARGCASTAWCLSVYQQHSWIVAHFPEKAQRETLATDLNFHIAAVLAPRGKARKVANGYVLSGLWPFASGCNHGTWIMLGGLVVDDEAREIFLNREIDGLTAQNARLFLLPIGEVENKDDWEVAGLAATGSHSIAVHEVFVPEHRSLSIPDAIEGRAPGQAVHTAPLFQTTYYSFLVTALGGLAPGVARGALEAFTQNIDKRLVMPINKIQRDLARTHRQIGAVETKIRLSELMLEDCAARITDAAETGRRLDLGERARCRLDVASAVDLAYEATEMVFFAAGGSTLNLKSPIQRAMRDMHGIKAHYFMDIETAQELRGMTALGLTPYTYVF